MRYFTSEPDPSRLINGLRDTGYSFETAAADITDNSIAAHADEISVEIILKSDGRKLVFFGDNGVGMSRPELQNAMRYGSNERENPKSLGKFGLGLKTASSSVCRKFSVVSRQKKDEELNKLVWDIGHVEKTSKWENFETEISEEELIKFEELCGQKGTLIIWEDCDRLLSKNYNDPGGQLEQRAIKRLEGKLKEHFSAIYHRFLNENDDRERNLSIFVNGDRVEHWDPMFLEKSEMVFEKGGQELVLQDNSGAESSAFLQAYILPHSNSLTEEELKKAKIANQRQGFYIYREGRLITQGGWLGVFGVPEPHGSLLRVQFDFDYKSDSAFNIDVKKSKIELDQGLIEALSDLLKGPRRSAQTRYRQKNKASIVSKEISHVAANASIANAKNVKAVKVDEVNAQNSEANITNTRGQKITIKSPIQNSVNSDTVSVEAVDTITDGTLWNHALRSAGDAGHVPSVLINKHHDFYQKVYARSFGNGYAIQGMDLLFWALASVELNYSSDNNEAIFEDIREEVSSNLRKLLANVELPSEADIEDE